MRKTLRIAAFCVLAGAISAIAERPLPMNLSGNWLVESIDFAPEKRLPASTRFLRSISVWGESSYRRKDNERPSLIPESYAIGISGGIEFFSFTEL